MEKLTVDELIAAAYSVNPTKTHKESARMKDEDVDWALVRHGFFHGNDSYRICCNQEQAIALRNALGKGAEWCQNSEIGEYVRVFKDHPAWPIICKMKS